MVIVGFRWKTNHTTVLELAIFISGKSYFVNNTSSTPFGHAKKCDTHRKWEELILQ